MPLIPAEALPYFENMIYLPMVLTVLNRDLETIEKGPFKLKRPYVHMVEEATRFAQADLVNASNYLHRHNMKVFRRNSDDTFTEYVFMYDGYEDSRRYLNVRLRNRTEELLGLYLKKDER